MRASKGKNSTAKTEELGEKKWGLGLVGRDKQTYLELG
jgi:hypothetical protein